MTAGPTGHTLGGLAQLVGGRVVGDVNLRILGISTLSDAGPTDLGLLADHRYLDAVVTSKAGALLLSEEIDAGCQGVPNRLVVADPRDAMAVLLDHLHPQPSSRAGVHPTAILGERVQLGEDVSVGPYVVIGNDVGVGDRTTLHAHVVLGERAQVGTDSVIHPHVVLYPGVLVGNRVVLHAGVRLGVDGFGYTVGEDGIRKIPHVGECTVADDVEIGANSCIDRGSIGRTSLGEHSKLDNLVHIGHNVTVGPTNFLAAQVGVAGSATIGEGTMWGGQSGLADHVTVGDGVRVAGQAGVTEDIPPDETVAGFPARPISDFNKAVASLYRLADLRKRVRRLERALKLDGGSDSAE